MVWWHHWLDGHEFEQHQELVIDREAGQAAIQMGSQRVGQDWVTELNNWLVWKVTCTPMFTEASFTIIPCGSAGKEFVCNTGDLGSIPGLGRSPGEGKGYPLQYSGLENCIDCMVYGVAKSRTWLSEFHFHFSRHENNLHNLHVHQLMIGLRRCGVYINWNIRQS